jgi:hypothetical protein
MHPATQQFIIPLHTPFGCYLTYTGVYAGVNKEETKNVASLLFKVNQLDE